MCGTFDTADPLVVIHGARQMADVVLEHYLRLPLAKALDLSSPKGFDRAVALLGARLGQASGPADAAAVRAALGVLDVDWRKTNAEQRRKLIAQATLAAGKAVAMVPATIRTPLGDAAEAVVAATRSEVRREQGLAIGAKFNALDGRITRHVVASQSNFVRNEYGRRVEGFSAKARAIVADGLERGLGRDDIAGELAEAAEAAFVHRAPSYWNVVAAAFTGQARSYSQMSSYTEAGIERYVFEAVLDERTTHICRLLHGKTFTVADALQRFERVEKLEDPEDIKRVMPWVREATDPDSGRTVLYARGQSGRVPIAEVVRSALGTKDDRGEFRSIASSTKLADLGVSLPPVHGACRSTVLAVV